MGHRLQGSLIWMPIQTMSGQPRLVFSHKSRNAVNGGLTHHIPVAEWQRTSVMRVVSSATSRSAPAASCAAAMADSAPSARSCTSAHTTLMPSTYARSDIS